MCVKDLLVRKYIINRAYLPDEWSLGRRRFTLSQKDIFIMTHLFSDNVRDLNHDIHVTQRPHVR